METVFVARTDKGASSWYSHMSHDDLVSAMLNAGGALFILERCHSPEQSTNPQRILESYKLVLTPTSVGSNTCISLLPSEQKGGHFTTVTR